MLYRSTCTRAFCASATMMLPALSNATLVGELNWPGNMPGLPIVLKCFPSVFRRTCTRSLPVSANTILSLLSNIILPVPLICPGSEPLLHMLRLKMYLPSSRLKTLIRLFKESSTNKLFSLSTATLYGCEN